MEMMDQTIPEKNNSSEVSTREKKIRDYAKLFNVDGDNIDFQNEFSYVVNIPKDAKDNILRISRMVTVSSLKISGYEEQSQGDTKRSVYKLVKAPFASSEVIKAFESILSPYCDESNIVTKKEWDSFRVQALADWGAFYKFCLRNKAQSSEHVRAVYRIFQGCLIGIGEITCDNPKNMEALFQSMQKDTYEDERGNPFQ